jgi:hypothetical protein
MEVKRKMTEMKNADVRIISLVTRAANRIPFRVVKHEENTMGIDLTSIGRLAKKAEAKPQVTGLVIFKQEDAEVTASIEAILKAEGFAVENPTENEDGTVLYAQAPAAATSTLIRLSDNMAVVVKGFEKQAEAMADAAEFSPAIPAEGFFHGPRVASAAYAEASAAVVAKGESVEAITKQYQAYMGAMAALPASVFKADALLEEVLKGKKSSKAKAMEAADAKDPDNDGDDDSSQAGDKDKDAAKKGEVTDPKAVAGSPSDDDTQRDKASKPAEMTGIDQDPTLKADPAQDPAADPVTKQEDPMAAVLAAITGLTEQVTALKSEMADQAKNFREELENVSRKSEDASKAVKNTVIATVKADSEPAVKVKTEKADPRTGCFDSATFRRR